MQHIHKQRLFPKSRRLPFYPYSFLGARVLELEGKEQGVDCSGVGGQKGAQEW